MTYLSRYGHILVCMPYVSEWTTENSHIQKKKAKIKRHLNFWTIFQDMSIFLILKIRWKKSSWIQENAGHGAWVNDFRNVIRLFQFLHCLNKGKLKKHIRIKPCLKIDFDRFWRHFMFSYWRKCKECDYVFNWKRKGKKHLRRNVWKRSFLGCSKDSLRICFKDCLESCSNGCLTVWSSVPSFWKYVLNIRMLPCFLGGHFLAWLIPFPPKRPNKGFYNQNKDLFWFYSYLPITIVSKNRAVVMVSPK